jgi:hypothetical protein
MPQLAASGLSEFVHADEAGTTLWGTTPLEHRVVVGRSLRDRLHRVPALDDLAVLQLEDVHNGVAPRAGLAKPSRTQGGQSQRGRANARPTGSVCPPSPSVFSDAGGHVANAPLPAYVPFTNDCT